MVPCNVHKLWDACSQVACWYLLCCSFSFADCIHQAIHLGSPSREPPDGMQYSDGPSICINTLAHTCLSSIIASTQTALQSKLMVTCRMMVGYAGASDTAKATKVRYGWQSETAWQTSLPACPAYTSRTAPFLGSSLKAAQPTMRFQVSRHSACWSSVFSNRLPPLL